MKTHNADTTEVNFNWWKKPKKWSGVVLAGLIVTIAGCGNTSLTNSASSGYLYSDGSSALFVQFTQTGKSLAGSLQEVQLSDSFKMSNENTAFTGTISGSSFSISFPQGFGTISTMDGQITNRGIVMNFPGNDGSLIATPMQLSTVTVYNRDVAAMNSAASTMKPSSQ